MQTQRLAHGSFNILGSDTNKIRIYKQKIKVATLCLLGDRLNWSSLV